MAMWCSKSWTMLVLLTAGLQTLCHLSPLSDQGDLLKTNFSVHDFAKKYSYLGCFDRGQHIREQPHIVLEAKLSSAKCYIHCMDAGFQYFGMRKLTCSCGNTYGVAGWKPEAECNYPCGLDPSEKCGGNKVISVYIIIERFVLIGCFTENYSKASDSKCVGDYVTKFQCSLRCHQNISPFFGLTTRDHACRCIYNIDIFVQRPDNDCRSSCLGTDTYRCGTSVYEIQYAIATEDIIGNNVDDFTLGFMGIKRQMMLTVNYVTLIDTAIDSRSQLYFRVLAEDSDHSGKYTELIGETGRSAATHCPNGWISYILPEIQTSAVTGLKVPKGYRCYLSVKVAQNWSDALQQCWEHDADLFYLEDATELDFLSTTWLTSINFHWIGMYFDKTLGTFQWLQETATNYSSGQPRPVITPQGKGCVELTVWNTVWEPALCSEKKAFLCKKYSALQSSWDQELPVGIPYGRRVSLELHQTATTAPVLRLILNPVFHGTFTAAIESHPGSRLHYSLIERVPMKICHTVMWGQPGQYNICSHFGNVSPKRQFGKLTCANSERLHWSTRWREQVMDWKDDVTYYVSDIYFHNKHNLSNLMIYVTNINEYGSGVDCWLTNTSNGLWQKWTCNRNARAISLFAGNVKNRYAYMCDIQVYGYLVEDKTNYDRSGQFKPSDRMLDLKMDGYIGDPIYDFQWEWDDRLYVEDLYLRVYHEGTQLKMYHRRQSPYFTFALPYGLSSDNVVMLNAVINHKTGKMKPPKVCSMDVIPGNRTCTSFDTRRIAVEVEERINLYGCSLSSQFSLFSQCEYAIDQVREASHRVSRCAQTMITNQPWWKAKVFTPFVFEKIILYSLAERNQWTKEFQISVDQSVCLTVRNGSAFIQQTFQCGLPGSEITVQALANNVMLSICEIVAYGRPGGCGDYQPNLDGNKCKGRLQSNIGYGKYPYEKGMKCVWTIGGAADQTVLLTFPEFRTGAPKDYLAVYDGIGTGGARLAIFQGNAMDKPKAPGMTVHGMSNFIRGRQSHLTLEFVTERYPLDSETRRTVETHLGFTAEFLLTHNDALYETHTPLPAVCNNVTFMRLINRYCFHRGSVHPIVTHGNETGMEVYNQMVASASKQQSSQSNNLDAAIMPAWRSTRDASNDTVDNFYCAFKELLPFHMRTCCCEECTMTFLISLCLQPYLNLVRSVCALNVTRII